MLGSIPIAIYKRLVALFAGSTLLVMSRRQVKQLMTQISCSSEFSLLHSHFTMYEEITCAIAAMRLIESQWSSNLVVQRCEQKVKVWNSFKAELARLKGIAIEEIGKDDRMAG